MRLVLAALALCLAQAAVAEVESSPRPQPNPLRAGVLPGPSPASDPVPAPVAAPVAEEAASGTALARSLRPMPRPGALTDRIAALQSATTPEAAGLAVPPQEPEIDLASVEPLTRAERRRMRREAASMEGAVCGTPAIKGEPIAPITSSTRGCGVADPVRVTSISGVRLSQAATVDCSIARALNGWVEEVAQPAFDGRLVELQVAAHYICRGRNNKKGAVISEHGKGRAIDISAFILSDGKVLTVAQNYNRLMRRIYKAACGYFKTTLGPGSDGYHEDHFHFDTSARSGGAYCR